MEDMRFAVTLDYEKLLRFAETIKAPFRKALGLGNMELRTPLENSATDDPFSRASATAKAVLEGQTLVVPLYTISRVMALLVIKGVRSGQLPKEVHPFLSALAENALDMVKLRLALETDAVSGLANKYSLDEALMGAMSRHMVSGRRLAAPQKLALLAMEVTGIANMQERYGRRFGQIFWKEMGTRLKELAEPCLCLGREDDRFWLLLADDKKRALDLSKTIQQSITSFQPDKQLNLSITWRMGAALPATLPTGLAPAEAANLLKLRARRALDLAKRLNQPDVLFFDEIVSQSARVKEILSFNRLILDLGRLHGLKENTRFIVFDQSGEKAEIQVADMGEEEALAEVTDLYQPTLVIKPGDHLKLMDDSEQSQLVKADKVNINGQEFIVSLDDASGLVNHQSFVNIFNTLQSLDGSLAVLMLKISGLDNLRQVVGRYGADHLFRVLADKAVTVRDNDNILLGRFSPDTMAALLPGLGYDEALAWAEKLMQNLAPNSERPLYAGVGYYPCVGFGPQDVLDNAAKALVHAEFMEPGSVVMLDAVSLNISGDALFNAARLSEAVAEYERALLLCDQELNVLNSLGICYAQLGRTEQAFALFAKAQQVAPHDYMAYYNEGYTLMGQNRWQEAKEKFEHCLTLQPDQADTMFQLGRVAQHMGLLSGALEYYQRAEASPQCPGGVFRHLGEVFSLSNRLSEAEEAFKRAVKFNSSDAVALNHLASLYIGRNANKEIALSLAKRALDINPAADRHWQVYISALTALNKNDEAMTALSQALVQHPDDTTLLFSLANLQIKTGRTDEARTNLDKVLALEPNLPEALAALAELPE